MAELDMDKIVKDAIDSLVIDGKSLSEWVQLIKEYEEHKQKSYTGCESKIVIDGNGNMTIVVKQGWISVKDRLPECEERVLLLAENQVTCGFYEDGTRWREDSKVNWCCDMLGDYDEEKDDYLIPEGWIEECVEEHDEYNCAVLGYKVTHWMPLPEPPKED